MVLLAALAQLKVMPYTIIYMPPGNASDSTYTTTTTFGTTMTAGDSTAIDNTTKTNSSLDLNATISGGFGLAGGDLTAGSHWDRTTSSDVGTVRTDSTTTNTTAQDVKTLDLSNPSLVHGADGPYTCSNLPCVELVVRNVQQANALMRTVRGVVGSSARVRRQRFARGTIVSRAVSQSCWLSEASYGAPLAFRTVREPFDSHGSSMDGHCQRHFCGAQCSLRC